MTHNEGDIGHCVNARSPTTRRIRGQRDASDQVVVTASSPPADTVDARTRRNSSRKSSPESGEKIPKMQVQVQRSFTGRRYTQNSYTATETDLLESSHGQI